MFKICQLLIVVAVLTTSVSGAENTILIPAANTKSHSGNYVAQESQWDNLGVFHGTRGLVTWNFNVKNAGKYYVQALYASGEKRPCTFRLTLPNGEKKELKSVFGEATGGFFAANLKWAKLPESFDFTAGDYTFTLSFEQCLPHFAGFRITTDSEFPNAENNPFLAEMNKRKQLAAQQEKEQYEKISQSTRQKLQQLLPGVTQILFIKRATFQSSHYYTDFIDGSRLFYSELCLLSLQDGSIQSIAPTLKEGIIGRCNLSYDGKKAIFDYKRQLGEGYRIWEVNLDGTGLRQLTFPPEDEEQRIAKYRMDKNNIVSRQWEKYNGIGAKTYFHHTDDFHPAYLPDGGFVFASTRCEHGILCDGPDVLTASVIYRADQNGTLEKLSDNSVSESCPTVMEDGRILYTRWEYVDNGSVTNKGLWAFNPDGTASSEIYGIDIVFPSVFNTARQIPGQPTQFVCIGAPHMPVGVGTVLLVDTRFNRRTVDGVKYVTPEIDQQFQWGWTKPVNGQPFTRLYEPPAVRNVSIQKDKSRDGSGNTNAGPLFMDPFPLDEHHFLVSYNPDKKWNTVNAYGIYLINDNGKRDLLFRDHEWSAWCPIPVRATVVPPLPVALRDSSLASQNLAQLIVTDVYAGMDGVRRGSVKYLRINEHVPRPWSARRYWDGDEFDQQHSVISYNAALGLRVQHGIVPVEKDGSANFVVPADKNIFLQALDENYREVQRERTFVNYRPGEVRSCVGCHEQASTTPAERRSTPLALRRSYSEPGPQPGEKSGSRPISYFEDVQPVWDRHCVQCHNSEKKEGNINLEGTLTTLFNVSYETLMKRNSFPVIGENHPKAGNNHYLPPYSLGSHAGSLIQLLDKGHYEVRMPIEDWVRLTTWVDSNGQYYGTYFGRKNLKYKNHPDFRPTPTFEETQHGTQHQMKTLFEDTQKGISKK
ncbi:MAG: hypothetical protein LBG58_12670 [Planctomycetaceae bacterium]|jgi:hypothetical protein|nr:hypothetical protein [Planctomycetaceae bacterium]